MTDETLVLAAIERSDRTWLSAAAVAADVGLPLERVQAALDSSPAVIIEAAPPGQELPAGQPRYSTREHYRATTYRGQTRV